MISVQDVTKLYRSGPRTTRALDGVTLEIAAGDFVAVGGPSGAGKSTLLAVIGGLLEPSQGEVLLEGSPVWRPAARDRARIRARGIGFIFQDAAVIRSLTVLENVLLPSTFLPNGASGTRDRARKLLDKVGLLDQSEAYPQDLSGGEKRRVGIASALMNDPPLLLADEPTGDLDAENEEKVLAIFRSLHSEGKTIVVVTHGHAVARVAERTLFLQHGRIVNGGGS